MGAGWLRDPKRVLVFNGNQTLVAIVRSVRSASELTGGNMQAISCACTGTWVSSGGFYYRHLDANVIVEMDDIATLKLSEYDELCGVERKYHTVREMARKHRNNLKKKADLKNNSKQKKCDE